MTRRVVGLARCPSPCAQRGKAPRLLTLGATAWREEPAQAGLAVLAPSFSSRRRMAAGPDAGLRATGATRGRVTWAEG